MEYSIQKRAERILNACLRCESSDAAAIFYQVAAMDFVRIHGPEHHILDGACLLTICRNAGWPIDLPAALRRMREEGLRMPGAACGLWDVCGAASSVGAALAILDGTGPLTEDGSWDAHMHCTAAALSDIAAVNGPRCCKRDALIALRAGTDYLRNTHKIPVSCEIRPCGVFSENEQCIGTRCPFYPQKEGSHPVPFSL